MNFSIIIFLFFLFIFKYYFPLILFLLKIYYSLVKLPEVRATMQAMAGEMMRAGMIEEMVDDTMSSMEVS